MRRIITEFHTCFTKKSTTAPNFIPVTEVMSTGAVDSAKMAIEILSTTSDIKVAAGYRLGDIPTSMGSPQTFGTFSSATYVNGNGTHYQDGFTDLVSSIESKMLIQFGFATLNISNTTLDMCLAAATLDIKEP